MDATSRPPASARRRPERREIVVVGAGVLGLAAARELAARGHDVLCLEQASVGGSRSGSKGRSRIFRLAYEDPLYVQLAERARPLWRSLENCSGRSLLQETGLLSFGEEIDRVAEAMASAGMPPERLTAAEVADTFPGIVCSGPALFERGAGVLAADEAMAALRETSGAELREGARVESMTLDESKGPEVLAGERRVSCALLVLCGGAWSARLAAMAVPTGAGLGAHLAPTLQQVAYFEHTSGALPADPPMPAFIERAGRFPYGLATPSLGLYKIGVHRAGPVVDPDQVELGDEPDDVAWLEAVAERVLPCLEPVAVETERCFYDNSSDGDFVIDRVGKVVIAAGTSGHGFKFGPVLGELLADLAEGGKGESRYSLGRFAGR